MLCQKYKQENSSTGRSIVTMCMLLPSGRKMPERNLIFMTDTFSLYCQSAGTKIRSWLESPSLLHVSSDDLIHQIKNCGLKRHSSSSFIFFSEDGTVTKICHNVACFLFSPFKFSSEINTKNPKIVVHLITPKISGKKKHLVKYLLCRQSNLSNRRFIFVFRALKLCTGSLNTFLRGT